MFSIQLLNVIGKWRRRAHARNVSFVISSGWKSDPLPTWFIPNFRVSLHHRHGITFSLKTKPFIITLYTSIVTLTDCTWPSGVCYDCMRMRMLWLDLSLVVPTSTGCLVFFTMNISLNENVSFAADLVNTFEDTHIENTPFKRQTWYFYLVFTKSVNSNFRAFWLARVTRNILGYSLFCERKEKWRVVLRKFLKKKLNSIFFIHLIW